MNPPENTSNNSNTSTTYAGGKVVNPETLVFQRAVSGPEQAHSIIERIIKDNYNRLQKDAAIMRKFNDEQPWNPNKLKAAGQSWRNNRCTGFLPSLVKRIVPPYKQIIDSARYLTSSKLRDPSPEAEQKSMDFQEETTRCIRQWDEWNTYLYQVTLEDVLFGHSHACWLDEIGWKPRFARGDDALFPDGCPQDARKVPLWVLRQNYLIHELATYLADPQASSAAGWQIDNLVNAINAAQPENRQSGKTENIRKFEDTVRESNIGQSFAQGVKVIETRHLFAQEANGLVTHWILDKNGKLLFIRYDRYEAMEECLALFAIEIGNGKLYGSKGAGRILYNTHVAVEQARNLICDNLYLSGLLMLKSTTRGQQTAAISVTHPVCIVGEGYDVVEAKFKVDTEAFFAVDRHINQIAELMIGAFMPGQLLDSSGEKRTASEVNYVAQVDQQIREGLLARFFGQFLAMVFTMQKRIYSKENIKEALRQIKLRSTNPLQRASQKMMDFLAYMGKLVTGTKPKEQIENEDAVETIICLLNKKLTPEDIFELANTPPQSYSQDMSGQNAAALGQIVARYMGNPSVDQQKLMNMDISSGLGNRVADELIIPAEDNTIAAEATRMQLLELTAMFEGDDMPVSPRDPDKIHMGVIMAKVAPIIQNMTPEAVTPTTIEAAQRIIKHFDDHMNGAIAKGMKPADLKEESGFSGFAHKLLDNLGIAMKGAPQAGLLTPPGASPMAAMAPGMAAGPESLSTDEAAAAAAMGAEPPQPGQSMTIPVPPASPGGLPLARGPQ